MKKFSDLNKKEEVKTVEEAKNRKDFIEGLIKETLTVEHGEIKGIDTLVKTLNSVMDINESKVKVNVLESVKAVSSKSFNFLKINEAIEAEKAIIKNYQFILHNPPVEEVQEEEVTEEVEDNEEEMVT